MRQLYANKMGVMIWRSKTLKKSALAKKTDENLLLIYDDEDINPHLKLAFIELGLDANWLYIDDSNVLQAWLSKPNSARAENLFDLTEYPFMVLRLGTVGYPNKALPGVICELLLSRVIGSRKTWIISPRVIRAETCREYSDELDQILNRHFTIRMAKHLKTTPDDLPEDEMLEIREAAEASHPDHTRGGNQNASANAAIRNALGSKK